MHMRYYETLYLINPNLAEDEYRGVVTKFNDLVEKHKGVVVKVEEWGKKPLAYEVKKCDKGFYVLLQYCGGAEIINELNREFRLDDRVLKDQTIKLSNAADPEALKAGVQEAATPPEEQEVTDQPEPEKEDEATDNSQPGDKKEDENGPQ